MLDSQRTNALMDKWAESCEFADMAERARPLMRNIINRRASLMRERLDYENYALVIASDHIAVPFIRRLNQGIETGPRLIGFDVQISDAAASETWQVVPK